MTQIERAMREAQGKVDLLCFGEAYLQGFDSLCWDYTIDKEMAVGLNSETTNQLCKWSKAYGVALLSSIITKSGLPYVEIYGIVQTCSKQSIY